jgi:hypothetical protein
MLKRLTFRHSTIYPFWRRNLLSLVYSPGKELSPQLKWHRKLDAFSHVAFLSTLAFIVSV